VLPDGWAARTVVVDDANTNGVRGLCLEPADLAVSKLAAGRPKGVDYVRVLLREGIVSPDVLVHRIDATPDVDGTRRAALRQVVVRLS
jgi:Nucleotidyltransferase of unknown function (DUF6036)